MNTLLDEVVMPPNNGSATLDRRTTMVYDTSNRLEEVRRDINSGGTQQIRVS